MCFTERILNQVNSTLQLMNVFVTNMDGTPTYLLIQNTDQDDAIEVTNCSAVVKA